MYMGYDYGRIYASSKPSSCEAVLIIRRILEPEKKMGDAIDGSAALASKFEAHIPQIKERYQQAYKMWGILRLEEE